MNGEDREHVRISFRKDGTPVIERGLLLPGWFCPAPECGVFNGEAKEPLDECRCCGGARP